MKTITKIKPTYLINLGEYDDLCVQQFQSLSDSINRLSRGLYRHEIYDMKGGPDIPTEGLFQEFNLHDPLQDRDVDEVWIFGSNKTEICMGGKRAFWLGNQPVSGTDNIFRHFPVMRFSRTANPLEVFAHRIENMMYHVYAGYPPSKNQWEKFICTEKTHPGNASCGTVIYPPNGVLKGYNLATPVLSDCDDWLHNYPELKGKFRCVDASDWGGTLEGYLDWWLWHLPHGQHKTDGIHDNWWHYALNFDLT